MTATIGLPAGATFADAIAAISDAAEFDRLREDYVMDRGATVRGHLVSTLVAAAHDWDPTTAERTRPARRHAVTRVMSACDPAVAAGHAVTLVDLCDAYLAVIRDGNDVRKEAHKRMSEVADKAARAQMDALRFLATHYPGELWP